MGRRRDDERFEIEPRRPRGGADATRPTARILRSIWHYARQSGGGVRGGGVEGAAPHLQRCAVRITYAANRVRGQWRAHGRYVAREAAAESSRKSSPREAAEEGLAPRVRVPAGYDRAGEGVDIAARLDAWQGSGDPRLFKFILSPEFGDRIELVTLTREVMARLEQTLGQRLEWVAVNHYNTEHPHTHVALRGVDARGVPVLLPRELVREGVRRFAQEACTRQLGYRSAADRRSAEAREVIVTRVTGHDRRLRAVAETLADGRLRVAPHAVPGLASAAREGLRLRLVHLEAMRLATPDGRGSWTLAGDFERTLGALAEAADRQRALARVHEVISDPHLPAVVTRAATLADLPGGRIAGRVLGHGEGDSGAGYMLLEGIDGNVHYFVHVMETERAHARGDLRTGRFVELSATPGSVRVESQGDATRWLRDPSAVARWTEGYAARGGVVAPGTERGWLGRFAAVRGGGRESRGR